jgi:hypothetical protein
MGNTTAAWMLGTLITYLAQEENPLVATTI